MEPLTWVDGMAAPFDQTQDRAQLVEPLFGLAPHSETHLSMLCPEATAEAFPLLLHGWLRAGPRFPGSFNDAVADYQPPVPSRAAAIAPAEVTEPPQIRPFGTDSMASDAHGMGVPTVDRPCEPLAVSSEMTAGGSSSSQSRLASLVPQPQGCQPQQEGPAETASAVCSRRMEQPARRLVAPPGPVQPPTPVGPELAANGSPRPAEAILFRLDDLQGVHRPLGRAVANVMIKQFRRSGFVTQDLSRGEPDDSFKWKRYIRSMSAAMQEDVVGAGITWFGLEVLDGIPDINTPDRDRVDFVVRRADGTSVRLHPHESRDAQVRYVEPPGANPLYRGRLARLIRNYHGGLAVGSLSPDVRCTVAGLHKLTDLIGRQEARKFLASLGSDTIVDLTDGILFGWPRWLASFPLAEQVMVIGGGLTKFTARPGTGSRRPAFVVSRADGTNVGLWPGTKLSLTELGGQT